MIRSVSIKNWKRHEDLLVSFNHGVNFIVGPNGAGKTSILDAICFALLGDLSATAIYKNITYKDLIRDSDRDMEIVLTFSPGEKDNYVIRRVHSASANRKSCELTSNGAVLARSWDEATEQILELYNTNDLFLRSVVLLSEGDTFAYSIKPPGEGLTKHIENVLGINRLEKLRSDLNRLRRDYELETQDWRARILGEEKLTEEELSQFQALSAQIEELESVRDASSEKLSLLNEHMGRLASDKQKTIDLIDQLKSIIGEWTEYFGDPPQNYEFLSAMDSLRESINNEKSLLMGQRDSIRDELAWLAAQIESQNQILSLIIPLEQEDKEVSCPVCKRPLTTDMVVEIKEQCHSMISGFKKKELEWNKKLPETSRKIQDADKDLQILNALEPKVRLLLEQEPKSTSLPELESHLSKISEELDSIQSDINNFDKQIIEKNEQISALSQDLGRIQRKIGDKERSEMMLSLSRSTKGQFVSQLILDSIDAALADQRKAQLEPLTQDLSATWSNFLGIGVGVELKEDAQLVVVESDKKRSYEFPQLSGGEKTALLIITQVSLCKHFSDANFMLLDEPLEHLDAKNRWSLIRFLVDTTRQGYPRQLIVTTVEESILREYLDESDVKINVLSRNYVMT